MFRGVQKCVNLCFSNSRRLSKISGLESRPDFTKNNFNVTRGYYNTLEEDHIMYFNKLLGDDRVIMDVSDLERYNVDWFKQLRGNSRMVLKPRSTEEVSQILSFCNSNRLSVCPQGGNTSVVGSSVPVFDEIIVNTDLMNNIISVDDISGVLICEAGCILENLSNYLAEKNMIMPVDLGAKGSCHIGGNVATNAGGLRLLRYGNLHGNVLGLEVVKANGEVLDLLSTLKKDNTGYHLKNLFIGSEGTLGFITKVAIQCPTKPKAISVALLGDRIFNFIEHNILKCYFAGLQSYEKVLKCYKQAKLDLGEILSAVEVLDTPSMQLLKEHLDLHSPIGDYPFYLIIETSGSNQEHDADKLNTFLELTLKKHFILNGTVTTEPTKMQAIWNIRERLPETFRLDGYVHIYDFTLPLEHYYNLVEDIREYMGNRSHRVFGFGHLGDGNIHLQISVKAYSKEIKDYIEPYIFNKVAQLQGSISAEHGIGFLKAKYLGLAKNTACVNLMRNLKNTLDPNGILNPYKVLSPQ